MKRNLYPLISVLIIFLSSLWNYAFAQPPQFRAQVDRVIMNNQFAMQMQMQMQMAQMLNMRGLRATVKEYDFIVSLSDSTTKRVVSAIYTDSATRKRFIIFVDNNYKKSDTNRYKKFYPAQTLSLTRIVRERDVEYNDPGSYLPGKITDTCWMFKVVTGAINVYADVCEKEGAAFNPASIVGIQLKNGPIVKYNEDNLKQMVGDTDIYALEAIRDKNLFKAIKKYNRDREKEAKK